MRQRPWIPFAVSLSGALSIVVLSGIATTAFSFAPAQTAASLPTVDQVLDKYVEALGGKAAVEKVMSRMMKGTIEAPATGDAGSIVPGTIEIDQKAPNKRVSVVNFPGSGVDRRGFNGSTGWYVDPDEGPKDVSAQELPAVKIESEFYRPVKLKELFPKISVTGKSKVGDHDTYVVEAPHEDGMVEKLYFDVASGLLVRDEVPVDIPDEGKTAVVNDLDDYRQVDGIMLPFTIRQTSPDFDYIIKFSGIQQNVAIDDGKFEKPATP